MSDPLFEMPDHIFLSYAHDDTAHAKKFHAWLTQTFATGCYWADGDASRGQGWWGTIAKALDQSKVAVILVTSRSRNRDWVNFEAGLCRGKGIRIFPIILPEHGNESARNQRMQTLDDIQHLVWSKDTAHNLVGEMEREFLTKGVKLKVKNDVQVNFCLKPTDFVGPRTEQEFIEELYHSAPLANSPHLRTRFLSDRFDLSPILIEAYIDEYCGALASARNRHTGTIPLSTRHRMKVALRILQKASVSVRAISVIKNDLWLNSVATNHKDDRYLLANCQVGKRLRSLDCMRRLIVCHEDEFADNMNDGVAGVIRTMLENDIELKWITEKALKALPMVYGAKPVENLLIVDKRWMTQSTGEGHDGQYSASENLIKQVADSFDDILWRRAHELPHPFKLMPDTDPTRSANRL